jgi:hypothetical protein
MLFICCCCFFLAPEVYCFIFCLRQKSCLLLFLGVAEKLQQKPPVLKQEQIKARLYVSTVGFLFNFWLRPNVVYGLVLSMWCGQRPQLGGADIDKTKKRPKPTVLK